MSKSVSEYRYGDVYRAEEGWTIRGFEWTPGGMPRIHIHQEDAEREARKIREDMTMAKDWSKEKSATQMVFEDASTRMKKQSERAYRDELQQFEALYATIIKAIEDEDGREYEGTHLDNRFELIANLNATETTLRMLITRLKYILRQFE